MDRKITPYYPFSTPIQKLTLRQKENIIKRYRNLKNLKVELLDFIRMVKEMCREVKIDYPYSISNKKIAFFFYIGKIKNFLKTESYLPDLPMILFLESLSLSAKNGNKFLIIVENEFFDDKVLNLPYRSYKHSMDVLEFLQSGLDMFKNLEFVSMKDLNEEIPDFEPMFESIKDNIKINQEDEVYKVLKNSIYFKNMKHALRYYDSERTIERVNRVYVNYMSFLEARNKVGYWDKLIQKYNWVRATVSEKKGIISIYPSALKIPAAHSIFNAKLIKDSYLIDELYLKRINYRVKVSGIPMYYV